MVDCPTSNKGSDEGIGSPSAGDLAIGSAAVILVGLKKLSSIVCVPFLGEATNIAVRLVDLVKDVHDNNDAFRLLGLQAGRLVWTIGIECRRIVESGGTVPLNIIDNINGLIISLYSIETFVEAKVRRRKFKRFIEHSSDMIKAAQYRDELRNALDQFAIQVGIAAQQALHSVNTTLQEHRVQASFDRIHHADTLNRLMQQQSDQMGMLHMAISSQYADDDGVRDTRECHAGMEKELAASKDVEYKYQETLASERKRKSVECQEVRRMAEDQEVKKHNEDEPDHTRKGAEHGLLSYDDQQKMKCDANEGGDETEEEREIRIAIAAVAMRERLDAERMLKREKEQGAEEKSSKEQGASRRHRKRQQGEEDALRAAEDDGEETQDAPGQGQGIAAGKRGRGAENANTCHSKTEVEITLTRRTNKGTPRPATGKGTRGSEVKDNLATRYKEVSREEFDRQVRRAFGHMVGFDDSDSDSSSSSDDESWSDEAPKERHIGYESRKPTTAARAVSASSFINTSSLSANVRDMAMQRVIAAVGGSAPFQNFRSPSPFMIPATARHRPRPASFAGSSNQVEVMSISVNNVSNSAISFGNYPAVVRNVGNYIKKPLLAEKMPANASTHMPASQSTAPNSNNHSAEEALTGDAAHATEPAAITDVVDVIGGVSDGENPEEMQLLLSHGGIASDTFNTQRVTPTRASKAAPAGPASSKRPITRTPTQAVLSTIVQPTHDAVAEELGLCKASKNEENPAGVARALDNLTIIGQALIALRTEFHADREANRVQRDADNVSLRELRQMVAALPTPRALSQVGIPVKWATKTQLEDAMAALFSLRAEVAIIIDDISELRRPSHGPAFDGAPSDLLALDNRILQIKKDLLTLDREWKVKMHTYGGEIEQVAKEAKKKADEVEKVMVRMSEEVKEILGRGVKVDATQKFQQRMLDLLNKGTLTGAGLHEVKMIRARVEAVDSRALPELSTKVDELQDRMKELKEHRDEETARLREKVDGFVAEAEVVLATAREHVLATARENMKEGRRDSSEKDGRDVEPQEVGTKRKAVTMEGLTVTPAANMLTAKPLLLPDEGSGSISANELLILYLTAVLDGKDIPASYSAEFKYENTQQACLVATFETADDALALKLAWDRAMRTDPVSFARLGVIGFYAGDTTVEELTRERAAAKLARFSIYSTDKHTTTVAGSSTGPGTAAHNGHRDTRQECNMRQDRPNTQRGREGTACRARDGDYTNDRVYTPRRGF